MKHLIFVLFFIPLSINAQEPRPLNLSPALERGPSILAKEWKYKAGDNPQWAYPDFEDSSWEMFTDGNLFNREIQKKAKKTTVVWFRKRIFIDSTTTQKLVLNVTQSGASEIYLDGELIHSLGKVSSNPDSVISYNPVSVPLSFPMKRNKEQLLAVRFANTKNITSLFRENAKLLTIHIQKETSPDDPLFVVNDSLFSKNGIVELGIRNGWRFHPGDDLNWANPCFDDKNWISYRPSRLNHPIPDSLWQGYGWFRFRFVVDSMVYTKVSHLYFETWGAAEVYLDGRLVHKFGRFSTTHKVEKSYMPYSKILPFLIIHPAESHVLAVRYSYHKGPQYKKLLGKFSGTLGFGIGLATGYWNQFMLSYNNKAEALFFILGTMLMLIGLLHVFIYLLFPAERSNLYISIVAFLLFLHILSTYSSLFFEQDVWHYRLFSDIPFIVLFLAALSMFPLTIGSMFNQKPQRMHKVLIWLFPVFALANFIFSGPAPNPVVAIVFPSLIIFYSSRILLKAWRNKEKGVLFVAGGFLGLIFSTVASVFYGKYSQENNVAVGITLTYLIYSSVPLGLAAFMAVRFKELYIHLEQKVKERTHELNQSLEDLKNTQTQLIYSEKMASLGALTAGIAHEIQNPLNFVNNFSELNTELIKELKGEAIKGNLKEVSAIANDIEINSEKINHHGKRADIIVKGMLLHSRSNSGQKAWTDLNKLADEYLRLSYHGQKAKDKSFHAEIKTDFSPELPSIMVVQQDVGRILLNLINNAFYAVNQKSWESVNGYKPEVIVFTKYSPNPSGNGNIEIHIRDNGPGIAENIKEKIFEPFFTTKPAGQGTGLGLSLSFDIVKAHGGELKVISEPGEFTEFVVSLPVNR